MADFTCAKCGSAAVEIVESVVPHCSVPVQLVQCAHCGQVVGVMESFDSSSTIRQIKRSRDSKPKDPRR